MRKILSLAIAALFSATMFAANVTLYFVNSNDWAAVHAYVFHDADPWPNGGAWPGEAMTKTADQAKGKDVYSYTFDTQYEVIIFNNGGNGQQSSNEVWDSAKPYYYEGSWYASLAAVEAAGEPETVTLYFVNDADWSTVNAYVYKNADPWPNGGAWPGATMTLTEEKANGKDIYKYTFNTQYDIVIFSESGNDSKKTGNLEWDAATPYYSKAQGQWYASAAAVPAVVVPAKFYICGTAVGVWSPDAVKSTEDSYTIVGLAADTEYKLKVTEDGTWDTAKGYSDLTDKPATLTTDVDDNIVFQLAAAGDVTVTYKKDDTFKLEGNFKATATGINDIENGEKAVKELRNGQVLIIKGNKTYNVLGQEVR